MRPLGFMGPGLTRLVGLQTHHLPPTLKLKIYNEALNKQCIRCNVIFWYSNASQRFESGVICLKTPKIKIVDLRIDSGIYEHPV